MKALRRVGLFLCLLGLAAGAGNVMAQTAPATNPPAAKQSQPAANAKPVVRQKQDKAAAEKKKPAAKGVRNKARKSAKAAPEPLPKAKLDLSLPTEMVKDLKPATQDPVPTPKPLLPYLFGEKPPADSPFQLNGRLLSNEMQLQLRNDERREVEGAAIDFEFKQ
ncbi:translation initiation factor 2 [Pseudomonas sp. BJa5]|uniref:translation initiation factor 2 n=1 Tax=Pseudomonas sp. BJa5 TaxID=2936270 RepID=UPI0025598BF5|nr:translation initiation factor 2 [Pseudomonas sp. BGr12]MDL2421064.1 translation initiation factor 2 [Pseudomonas sp. BGr12]